MSSSTTAQPSGRRAQRREERRQQILSAAMTIVLEQGIDQLTMPRIADEIDAAVGGLYRYFPSKDHLVVALEMWSVDAFRDHLEARVELFAPGDDERTSALSRVWTAFDSWFTFAEEEPALHRLMDTLISVPLNVLDDASDAQVQSHVQPILRRCAETLAHAARVGALAEGDAMVRTHVMWGALHGLGHFRKMDHRRPPELHAAALRDRAIETLLLGWGGQSLQVTTSRDAARVA